MWRSRVLSFDRFEKQPEFGPSDDGGNAKPNRLYGRPEFSNKDPNGQGEDVKWFVPKNGSRQDCTCRAHKLAETKAIRDSVECSKPQAMKATT